MIDGMEAFVGRKLNESILEQRMPHSKDEYYIITRPDFYSDAIHINMYVFFNEDGIITDFDGDKCYSICRGLYNRHSNVYDREFTRRDIQYLRRFVRENTAEKMNK
jgi:hypothetical protein